MCHAFGKASKQGLTSIPCSSVLILDAKVTMGLNPGNEIPAEHMHLYFLRSSSYYEISLDFINPFGGVTGKFNKLHHMARDASTT